MSPETVSFCGNWDRFGFEAILVVGFGFCSELVVGFSSTWSFQSPR